MSQGKSEPAVVKQLCAEIAAEENPNKVIHLVESLRNSVDIEHEEARLRLRLIAQQYRQRMQSAPLKTKMLDVLGFLGLVRSRGDGETQGRPLVSPDVTIDKADRGKQKIS
jgi:hypothetical protein